MSTLRCPVCKKPLTKDEYERALGILGAREEHLMHQQKELRAQLRAAARLRVAKQEGIQIERERAKRLFAGKEREVRRLQERIRQLERGSTPQTEGLEFEDKLAARLRREFPKDEIQHKGKGGDVLHVVKFDQKAAGTIIYECKRTPRIQGQHIVQARLAKRHREADFAVLVTNGQKKGFSGFTQMGGVFVVSPLGAIPLSALLRLHLIEMLKLEITKEERAIIAQRLVDYITSPQFKNPLEEVVRRATDLQEALKEEVRDHLRTWKRRWEHYRSIHWDTSRIRHNLDRVVHGHEPQAIGRPEPAHCCCRLPLNRNQGAQDAAQRT